MTGSNRFGYSSLERQRQRLPVFKYRNAILYLVENHATTIIVGETGSGKTTQIPQVRFELFALLVKFVLFDRDAVIVALRAGVFIPTVKAKLFYLWARGFSAILV